MIKRVEYSRVDHVNPGGLRIMFVYENTKHENSADIFDFYDPDDVNYVLPMLHNVSPEALMVEIRNRMRLTLH